MSKDDLSIPCTVQQICSFLETNFPLRLAESWDNVGLLLGDRGHEVRRLMTCLTVTPETVAEGIEEQADLLISHHPLPFRPLQRITFDTVPGRLVGQLLQSGISLYSPHTAFDSGSSGINQQLAVRLGLKDIRPLRLFPQDPDQLGAGRVGELETPLSADKWITVVKQTFGLAQVGVVSPDLSRVRGEEPQDPTCRFGKQENKIHRVAVACGSAGELLAAAVQAECDAMVMGETTFHTCLEARAQRVLLVLMGHFASERFAIETLARQLQTQFPSIHVWASLAESDPIEVA